MSANWPGTIPNRLPCANCGKRPGSLIYAEDGGLAVVHGMYEMWCERCVLEKQIEHAEERAASLPELRSKLAALSDPSPEPTGVGEPPSVSVSGNLGAGPQ